MGETREKANSSLPDGLFTIALFLDLRCVVKPMLFYGSL